MNKVPTVKEFLQQRNSGVDIIWLKEDDEIIESFIEFAKLHVEAALKAANENAKIIDDPNSYTGNTGSEYLPDQIIDSNSILNAYPKELIK